MSVVAVALMTWTAPVFAISPATIDQIVCGSDVIVEATVTSVRGTCEKGGDSIRCTGAENASMLDLKIDRVLARKPIGSGSEADVTAGETVSDVYVGGIEESNGERLVARILPFVVATRFSGAPVRRWSEISATSDDAVRIGNVALKGVAFVVGLLPTDASRNKSARMWRLDDEAGLLELLRQTTWPRCPAPVEEAH